MRGRRERACRESVAWRTRRKRLGETTRQKIGHGPMDAAQWMKQPRPPRRNNRRAVGSQFVGDTACHADGRDQWLALAEPTSPKGCAREAGNGRNNAASYRGHFVPRLGTGRANLGSGQCCFHITTIIAKPSSKSAQIELLKGLAEELPALVESYALPVLREDALECAASTRRFRSGARNGRRLPKSELPSTGAEGFADVSVSIKRHADVPRSKAGFAYENKSSPPGFVGDARFESIWKTVGGFP